MLLHLCAPAEAEHLVESHREEKYMVLHLLSKHLAVSCRERFFQVSRCCTWYLST